MSRRRNDKAFEDDERVIADMSGLKGSRSFTPYPSGSLGREPEKKSGYGSDYGAGWEPPPFSWKERFHYIGAALGASLLIALAFIAGLGLVVWLITLYGSK